MPLSVGLQAVTLYDWSRTAVIASLVDSQLNTQGLGISCVASKSGIITGIVATLSIVAAGAALTATVFKNGVATAITCSIAVGQSVGRTTGFSVPLAAGDTYDIRINTPVGWTALTANLIAAIEYVSA